MDDHGIENREIRSGGAWLTFSEQITELLIVDLEVGHFHGELLVIVFLAANGCVLSACNDG